MEGSINKTGGVVKGGSREDKGPSLIGLRGPALADMGANNRGSGSTAAKEKLKSIEQHATTILDLLDEVKGALPPAVE